jgi:hypothetical protein
MKSMIIFFYFILIILAVNIKKSIQSYIIYSFKKSKKQIKLYPQNLLQNDLEIAIEIGTPPQNIDLNIRFQTYTFFISSLKTNLTFPVFNESNSKSLVMISHRISSVGGQEFISCYRINESIIINHQEIKNISLALATSSAYNESGVIGFGLVKSHDFGGALSFLYQMKNNINLDNYAFTLRYDNDDGGELILGTYPHLYDKNYKEKKFLYTKVGNIGVKIDWVLDFDFIKYDNQIINGIITKCLIKVEFGLIQAPIGLKQYFNDNFFFNKCKEEFYSGKNLTIIHCDKNFDIKSFKNLSFSLKDIEYEFNLTYKELFIEKDDEYIFSIVFDNKTINSDPFWVLGELFIKKYQLVYDLNKKIIGLYTEIGNQKEYDNVNKSDKKINIYLLMIFVLLWIIIALIIFIFLFFNKPKRNKALELNDDSLDYIATN